MAIISDAIAASAFPVARPCDPNRKGGDLSTRLTPPPGQQSPSLAPEPDGQPPGMPSPGSAQYSQTGRWETVPSLSPAHSAQTSEQLSVERPHCHAHARNPASLAHLEQQAQTPVLALAQASRSRAPR